MGGGIGRAAVLGGAVLGGGMTVVCFHLTLAITTVGIGTSVVALVEESRSRTQYP